MRIESIKARNILDSRGKSTVEARLKTKDGVFFASAPSGTSVGSFEAKIVSQEKAVENIEKIIGPAITSRDFSAAPDGQKEIDRILLELDGTSDKSRLGANGILPVSMAFVRAAAAAAGLTLYNCINKIYRGQPSVNSPEGSPPEGSPRENLFLPRPCLLVVEAGRHGQGPEIQEFMVVPDSGVRDSGSFANNLKIGKEIYKNLGKILRKETGKGKLKTGLEGGYTGLNKNSFEILDLIKQAVGALRDGGKIDFYLDVAASEFFRNGFYEFESKKINGKELGGIYKKLAQKYPIAIIEDPFYEEDWESWQGIKSKVKSQKSKVLIVGDDLTVSNPERIKKAREKNACNAIILKPNQIGTVSEAVEAVVLAKSFGWKIIVSHRSGETMDDFIADFAVGVAADFIKSGAPKPKERMVKYKRIVKIEKELKV